MGLTLHWTLALRGDRNPAEVLESLRQAALDLPFQNVTTLESIDAETCRTDPPPFFDAYVSDGTEDGFVDVPPLEVHGFRVDPAQGSESATFFLARYPRSLVVRGSTIRVPQRATWTSTGSCKTQYASNHGVASFVRCHVSLVQLLDRARELGMHVTVMDEGDFAKTRSVKVLEGRLAEANELVAAMGVMLRRELPEHTKDLVSGLDGRPDLEHLEARGLDRFPHLANEVRKIPLDDLPRKEP